MNEETNLANPWAQKAIQHAEEIGVSDFWVNMSLMEYWSFYGSEGWYFVRYDLKENKEVFHGANIPWDPNLGIPSFFKGENGETLYNYMQG